MRRPSIPTRLQSPAINKEEDMPSSIRTEIGVHSISLFRIFLDANDMDNVKIGTWQDRINSYQVDTKICYLYDKKDEAAANSLVYISVKYGSLEAAFKHYLNVIGSLTIGDHHMSIGRII